MRSSVIDQRVCQSLPISSRKSERAEKLCLARPFWMIKGKEVIGYLALLNKSIVCIRKVHSPDPRSCCVWRRAESRHRVGLGGRPLKPPQEPCVTCAQFGGVSALVVRHADPGFEPRRPPLDRLRSSAA
jgi:hypothetical protein